MSTLTRRDKWIPWYFVLFFAVLIVVDGVMVTLAVTTQTGVVTDHPYEKGLAYNKVLKSSGEQDGLGWKGNIVYENGTLRFDLKDNYGMVLKPASITAHISRPTQASMDFTVTLLNGSAPLAFPQPGLWKIHMLANVEGKQYQQAKRMVIP